MSAAPDSLLGDVMSLNGFIATLMSSETTLKVSNRKVILWSGHWCTEARIEMSLVKGIKLTKSYQGRTNYVFCLSVSSSYARIVIGFAIAMTLFGANTLDTRSGFVIALFASLWAGFEFVMRIVLCI